MGCPPPLSQQTEQYLPRNDHSVSNISKHMYNCEGTPQLHWFYHATFFSPAKTTFLAAIKQGYLQGCPGLTYESAKQYIAHNEVATIKGHMNQKQQGTQSTKQIIDNRQHGCHFSYFATTDTTSIIYADQTRKFPIQSSRGYKYVVICYAYSCDAILAYMDQPMNYYRHISISTYHLQCWPITTNAQYGQ